MATILDGRELSKKVRFEIKNEVAQFETEYEVIPTLALVRAGDDPASVSYAGMIERTCKQTGINFEAHTLPAETGEEELVRLMRKLNN
ncbi:MAG: tetrahydrofolate dehydrogenase/cyclohydrolase catalytic domain-containing protein, partial [Anaerolineae bacterium]